MLDIIRGGERPDPGNLDLKFKLMEYHRSAMETRRAVQFKAFLALITLFLILGKAAPEIIKASSDPARVRFLFGLLLLVSWGCFLWAVSRMEDITRQERDKYKPLERELWDIAQPGTKSALPPDADSWGWAAMGPLVVSFTLGLAIFLLSLWC